MFSTLGQQWNHAQRIYPSSRGHRTLLERTTIWKRHSRNRRRPAKWDKIDDPVVLLESNQRGHPLAGLLWERKLEETLLQ